MLLFGARTYTIEGITIFPDHADQNQFWYLPGPVQLARRRADGRADLTFIKYRPAAVGATKGGGFLMFSTNLRLDPIVERRILARLSAATRGRPKLAAAPFDEGTVKVVALDFQSGGEAGAPPPPPGAIRAVEKALGATVPSLHGDNTAAFSLTLSQEGAIIIEKALQQGTTPVGVVYDLKFTAMRPALNVKITADMKRVYEQFSMGAEGQYYFVKGGIDAGFEKLLQDGAIKIEVTDFIGAQDRDSKEQWAIDFFKDNLLSKYFEPSLTPGNIVGGIPQPEGLAQVVARGMQLRPPQPEAPPKPTANDQERPRSDPADSPTAGTGNQTAGAGGGLTAPPEQAAGGDGSPTAGTGGPPAPATSGDMGSAAAAGLAPAIAEGGRAVRGYMADGALASTAGYEGMAKSAAASQGMPVVSFKFRGIRQEERKTITLEYNRSEAVQRSYAPQGFVGLLAADLDLKTGGHFVEVDLDDPFFREFEVTASAPIDFARIGLNAAEVALSYGRTTDPGGPKVRDIRFSTADKDDKSWKVFTNAAGDSRYKESTQYHFDALSGWDGARNSYEFGPTETADRSLLLNPFEHLGFIETQVVANRVDWGIVDRVEIELRYDDGAGWKPTRTVTLKADTPRQEWKIRTANPARRSFDYKVTFRLTDRTVRIQDWQPSTTPSVVIDDPFPGELDFQIIPILDSNRTKMAFLDISYEDKPNKYKRQARIKILPEETDKPFRLALMNPDKREFRYRITLVPTSGRMQPGPLETSEETLIGIND
jgi:hypothetical protein